MKFLTKHQNLLSFPKGMILNALGALMLVTLIGIQTTSYNQQQELAEEVDFESENEVKEKEEAKVKLLNFSGSDHFVFPEIKKPTCLVKTYNYLFPKKHFEGKTIKVYLLLNRLLYYH